MGAMNLIVKLLADTKPFEQGMKRAGGILKDLDQSAGGRSQLKKTLDLFKGAGAFAGLALGAKLLENMTAHAREMANAFRRGEESIGSSVENLVQAVPVLGSIRRAGLNIRAFFGDDPEEDLRKAKEDNARLLASIDRDMKIMAEAKAKKKAEAEKKAEARQALSFAQIEGGAAFEETRRGFNSFIDNLVSGWNRGVAAAKKAQKEQAEALAAMRQNLSELRIEASFGFAQWMRDMKPLGEGLMRAFVDPISRIKQAITGTKFVGGDFASSVMARLGGGTTVPSTAPLVTRGSSEASAIMARIASGKTSRQDPTQTEIKEAIKAQLKSDNDRKSLLQSILDEMKVQNVVEFGR